MKKTKRMHKPKGKRIPCPHCNGAGTIIMPDPHIGDMIAARRKLLGMTQADLAKAVKLSRGQVANTEAGRSDVTVKTLARYGLALQIAPGELLRFLANEQPDKAKRK